MPPNPLSPIYLDTFLASVLSMATHFDDMSTRKKEAKGGFSKPSTNLEPGPAGIRLTELDNHYISV
jgi:hypothetical protein